MATSSSSSSPFAPAVSSHSWKYNVFLSFRGEDTRNNFVDHLYLALSQQGIYTYKDDETLPRGESIAPHLETAIEESQILVVIFSQNYADSSWCLAELAHIMKCKDMGGNIVLPIFYDVEPSTVRKQEYKYGKTFSKHELQNKDKLESWRQALVDASNLSGWEIKQMANGHESKAVKEIVDTISRRLHPLTSSADVKLIGINGRMNDLKSKLEIGSGGVRMIGIWGVGGGGKTTLALSVYREISTKFDSCCFMENIREESSKHGLDKLQKKVLSDVLKQKLTGVNNIGGRWLPNDRLRHMKVLIVLDDVDHLDQLRMLVGSNDWFGDGSRIILTTRDQHLLTAHRVNFIYNIMLLNDDEAIKLLRNHAHLESKPMKDYDQLCQDVVSYAGGLPLALTILGCFLCDKDINEWRSTLARLKEIPETGIVEKLKISYDGLKPVEKELFLDIACFFRGVFQNESAMAILDANGFHPAIGVKVLIQKALITVSDGKFDMHDLVQEMGHYIVGGKHPNSPEKHSRVWKKEDVLKIFAKDATKELDKIETIVFRRERYDAIDLRPTIVANMKKLRWVNWTSDLASPLPTNFLPVELRCLTLNGISQKELWNGYKHMPNLKMMELVRMENLIKTPDFDGLPNLERFVLHRCWRLKKIHPSIGRLQKLVYLSIAYCYSLEMLPPITELKKLKTLTFPWNPTLHKLLEIQQQKMVNLPHNHLDNSGKEVASNKKASTNFFVSFWMFGDREVRKPGKDLVDIEQCSLQEPCLPHNNMNHHTHLRFFPTFLRTLDLSYCNMGDNNIGSTVWELPNLEELNLAENRFTRLNFSVLRLPRLKTLIVIDCKSLVELSELPSSIAIVMADGCSSLESLGDILNCKWLWKVSVLGDNKLGPHFGDILLDSMLQGNALEDHFISVGLFRDQMIPKRFVGRLYNGDRFTKHLPDDWYNDFCGFLICVATPWEYPCINIVITHEANDDSPSELCIEAPDPTYNETIKFVGYVSFSSLRLFTSSYKSISFYLEFLDHPNHVFDDCFVGAELVPKKSKVDKVQATNCSEFWDKEYEHTTFTITTFTTFTMQHDSQIYFNILWQPYYETKLAKLHVVVDVQNDNGKMKAMRAVYKCRGVMFVHVSVEHKFLAVTGTVFDMDKILKKLRKYWPARLVSYKNAVGW